MEDEPLLDAPAPPVAELVHTPPVTPDGDAMGRITAATASIREVRMD